MPLNGAVAILYQETPPMVDTPTVWEPPPLKPLPRTHIVRVIETRGRRFNAYSDGHLLASETSTPFKDAARALLLEFGNAPEDTVVLKVGGVSGLEREALVRRLGDMAAKQD
jgi:hypothetical protein